MQLARAAVNPKGDNTAGADDEPTGVKTATAKTTSTDEPAGDKNGCANMRRTARWPTGQVTTRLPPTMPTNTPTGDKNGCAYNAAHRALADRLGNDAAPTDDSNTTTWREAAEGIRKPAEETVDNTTTNETTWDDEEDPWAGLGIDDEETMLENAAPTANGPPRALGPMDGEEDPWARLGLDNEEVLISVVNLATATTAPAAASASCLPLSEGVGARVPLAVTPSPDSHLDIYGDGSFFGADLPRSGWGLAYHRDQEWHTFHAPTRVDPNSPVYVGAAVESNNTGELEAVIRAMQFSCSPACPAVDTITYHYDSTYAAMVSQGMWTGAANLTMVQVARGWVQQASLLRLVNFEYVPAHVGIEGNELVDEAAKKGAQQKLKLWEALKLDVASQVREQSLAATAAAATPTTRRRIKTKQRRHDVRILEQENRTYSSALVSKRSARNLQRIRRSPCHGQRSQRSSLRRWRSKLAAADQRQPLVHLTATKTT